MHILHAYATSCTCLHTVEPYKMHLWACISLSQAFAKLSCVSHRQAASPWLTQETFAKPCASEIRAHRRILYGSAVCKQTNCYNSNQRCDTDRSCRSPDIGCIMIGCANIRIQSLSMRKAFFFFFAKLIVYGVHNLSKHSVRHVPSNLQLLFPCWYKTILVCGSKRLNIILSYSNARMCYACRTTRLND